LDVGHELGTIKMSDSIFGTDGCRLYNLALQRQFL